VLFAYLDASALAKRYVPEPGTPTMNHLFARIPPERLAVLTIGLAEVVSILVRQRNTGQLPQPKYAQTFTDFVNEVVLPPDPRKLRAGDVTRAFRFIESYSLNATDAILLRSALDFAGQLRAAGHELVVVASDQRLLKAAGAEGLLAFNPETQSTADLDALIGP
jgi:predicted nucleic acid-binding protein